MNDFTKYNIDQNEMIMSFNKAALSYDEVAFIQREVADRLIKRLNIFKINPTKILDVGMGTGYLTKQLATKYSSAQVCGIDIAKQMLQKAKSDSFKNISLICGEASLLPFADHSMDIVISNMMLHWCADLHDVFMEFKRILKPDGLLLFSSLGPDTLQELRQSWAVVDHYSHVNRFIDMHNIGDLMLEVQLQDPVMDMEYIHVMYQSVHDIMRDLKNIGAHNVIQGRRKQLTGKGRLQQMINAYEQYRNEQNTLPVTYEVIYGHALGGEIKDSTQQCDVEIPITAIRRMK